MPIKLLLLGGGGFWAFLEGGVEVPILFLWAWGFFRSHMTRLQERRVYEDYQISVFWEEI